MIDSVAAFVTQKLQAPIGSSALHFQHLTMLERLEPRMREIKRQCDGRNAGGRKPLIT